MAELLLRERVLAWCLDEAERRDGQPVPDDRVAQYLSGCSRDGVGNLGGWLARKRLKGSRVAFCAAARGYAEYKVRNPDEVLPPWRAGARENAGFYSIGANERGGRWYLDREPVPWNHPRLLGFVVEDPPAGVPAYAAELGLELPPTDLIEDDHLDLDAILARQLDLTPDWAAIRADIQRRIAEKF